MSARRFAWLVVLAALGAGARAATVHELLLSVRVNGQLVDPVTVVLRRGGRYLFAVDDLRAWRLRYRDRDVVQIDGHRYARLPDGALLASRIDASTQTLHLTVRAGAFVEQRIDLAPAAAPLTPAADGGFANYDLSWQRSDAATSVNALGELGAFDRSGTALTRFVVQRAERTTRVLRLDSTLQRDFTARMSSLQIGDVLGAAGPAGTVAMLGGVRYSTDFSTRPDYVTTPLLTVRGSAALPSTLQVYIDNVLALQRSVPSGPFAITHLPLIDGSGEVSTVVTDVLGRQQVMRQPYVVAPQLLRPGLHAFTLAAGWLRRNFGVRSADYGSWAATASYRVGLSDAATAAWRGSLQGARASAGTSLDWATPQLGVVSTTLAASRAAGLGRAAWMALGVQRTRARLSLALQVQHALGSYLETGADAASPDGIDASAALQTGLGAISLAYLEQHAAGGATRIVQLADSIKLRHRIELGVTVLRTVDSIAGTSTQLELALTMPLGSNHVASALWSSANGWQAGWQRNLPDHRGWGYSVQAGARRSALAQLHERGPYGVYGVEVQRNATMQAERLSARGGLALLDSTLLPAPTLHDSFALVELPGLRGIAVDVHHERYGRTDSRGDLLVSGLAAYQRNAIDIEPAGLPLDAAVTTLHTTCTPPRRSGVVLRLPLRVQRQATLTLLQDNGRPVPTGALARLRGSRREFPVGTDGRAFLSGLHEHNRVLVDWPGGACALRLRLPSHLRDPLPELGRHLCSARRRPAAAAQR